MQVDITQQESSEIYPTFSISLQRSVENLPEGSAGAVVNVTLLGQSVIIMLPEALLMMAVLLHISHNLLRLG
jgi:hypothetical protein